MRNEFLEILTNLDNTDLGKTPNYIFMKNFAIRGEHFGSYPCATFITSKIKINVNQNFIEDKELFDKTIETYINCLNRLWKQLKNDFGELAGKEMFLEMVGQMSIEYNF